MDSDHANVYFPMGYQLPETEQDLRSEILHLISVLKEFLNNSIETSTENFQKHINVDFPINSYLEIIHQFLNENAYYVEKEEIYKTNDRGKIHWEKTIKKQKSLIQANGSPVYLSYTVRMHTFDESSLITKIHKYCVYESFSKLGWLFTSKMPENPSVEKNNNVFLTILNDKLSKTNNDKNKKLFYAMISIINYMDETSKKDEFYYGTEKFEYVWEKMVDKVFGVKNKKDYFPKTRWTIRTGIVRTNSALEPDTIMLYEDKIYVLDAKYYRYGITGNLKDLPPSSSINKQITYGEYIYSLLNPIQKDNSQVSVYNAFIMPYNAQTNLFDLNKNFENIGEATGDWKNTGSPYEYVQGILLDVKYLMYHYIGDTSSHIKQLALSINKNSLDENLSNQVILEV